MNTAVIIALRENRGVSVMSVIVLVFLLFPTFSTADDFHVCHLSIAHFFDTTRADASLRTDSHKRDPEKATVCIACLWSTFEGTPPSTPVILDPAPSRVECCQTPEPALPFVETFSSLSERAPPFV
ncbi:MAG: hypothetical protein LAO31_04090 [Acidobacteriia bacterium]|nr:hypothetical protein [Terriglobia bacterium]